MKTAQISCRSVSSAASRLLSLPTGYLAKWLSRLAAHHCLMAQVVRLLQRRGQRPSSETSILHSDTIF